MSRTWTIALHFNVGYEVTLRILHGVIQYAQEHPELVLREFNFVQEDLKLPQPPPWIGKADGLLMNLARLEGVSDWLRRSGMPTINTGGDLRKEKRVVSVYTDPASVAKLAVDHLLDAGLRHFLFVGDRKADATPQLHSAMSKALAPHRLKVEAYAAETVYAGTFEDFATLEQVEPGLVRVIREAKKPLGLLAQTDRYAAAICRVIELLGLAIPDDVAVVGVHDTEMARLSTPPISSIRPPHQAIGHEAARVLHGILRGERLARRKVLLPAVELVERASTIRKPLELDTEARWSQEHIRAAQDYIGQHAVEGICIRDVAAHVHMPRRTFEAEFAAAVGHPIGEAIRRARLERIKDLLETTDLPLEQVARLTGLATSVSLIRIVTAATGMSPTEYRRAHRDEPKRNSRRNSKRRRS